jgi:glycosyltransferase involved in cell wall biosynthesis
MKISVIVPVYNTEKYLSKCLNYLLNKTLAEMEIVVVNDGSTDGSQKIIDDFSAKFPQIKSFQKPNGGLSDARNFGIEKANGEFIGFVDSDDFVDETMFEKMHGLAEKYRAEIVFCDLVKVDENGNEIRELPQSPQLPEKIELEKNFEIFGEMSCFACNKIFKKSLFNNLQFRVGIHFEDVELIPKLMLNSTIIAKINRPFYHYFERNNSITKSHTEKGLDMFRAVENVISAFEKSKYNFNQNELERFLILQGFYSYLAYVAYVKDKNLKKLMLKNLAEFLRKYQISKFKILNYRRFNQNYLLSLPFKKRVFYLLVLVHRNLILSL